MKYYEHRIAILGCPSFPDVSWNTDNLQLLKNKGFNTIQLNIAWGARPADEPLNLEDVVDLPAELSEFSQKLPLKSNPDSKKRQQRQDNLRKRIQLCKDNGLRTLFHFGAPYNGSNGYDGSELANCILDKHTLKTYEVLLEQFSKQFPSVDDILVYTYDQDAWICNEFGDCKNCAGAPLHLRLPGFVNNLARKWKDLNSSGRLWWEPWELSAGQSYYCFNQLDSECVGLCLHSNIAEVMAAMPVDRWLVNACNIAKTKNLPVIVEGWLGVASEELEPFRNLAHPFVTFRQIKKIASVGGVCGIKEYYGLLPQKSDPNLEATSQFLLGTDNEDAAIQNIADNYCRDNIQLRLFWQLCSEAMEIFPWDTSWYIREIGKSSVHHSMDAAFIRGQQCATPSWESTRRAIFMKTDDKQPHPWMLEDVQLRCALAADKMEQAVKLEEIINSKLPESLRSNFQKCVYETKEFIRRVRAYELHLRETNIAFVMRRFIERKIAIPQQLIDEMELLLRRDIENQQTDKYIAPALNLLNNNIDKFVCKYFNVVESSGTQGGVNLSASDFSVTSRSLPVK